MQAQNFKTATTAATDPANARGSSVQISARADQFALLNTLKLVQMLQFGPLTPRILRTRLGLDADLIVHHLVEAKHLGAALEKLVLGGRVFWALNNWSDCQATVERWIELETARSLIKVQS